MTNDATFEVEAAVVGAVLTFSDAAAAVPALGLGPAEFAGEAARAAWAAIQGLVERGEGVGPLEVAEALRERGQEAACDLNALVAMAAAAVTPERLPRHAERLRAQARARRLRALGLALAGAADDAQRVRELLELAQNMTAAAPAGDDRRLRIIPGDEFLRMLRIPEFVVDGLLPRGQLYALTAPTGHGKTAVAALMQICIAAALAFAGREVQPGRVLVLAGENPDDYGLRLLATCQALGLKPEVLRSVYVIPGSFGIAAAVAEIKHQAAALGGDWSAVFVDTSAAFFDGDDENANTAMRLHASHLRSLTELDGHPLVVVLCHPTKSATKDNLLPRGGGAFLAEIDGNLTVWRDDRLVTLSWQGKLRGPGFEPLTFELQPQTLAITDSKGRPVSSVAAVPATGDRAEALEAAALSDENRMLRAMLRTPNGSIADLALAAGFASGMGSPNKARAHRVLKQLAEQQLAKKNRAGRWVLTGKGRSEADEVPAS